MWPRLDVADDVVDREQPVVRRVVRGLAAALVARQERALVALALHEQVLGLAVGGDRGELHLAALVLHPVRGQDAAGAVADGMVVRGVRVGDAQRDLVDAVAVQAVVHRDVVAAEQGARDDEPDPALLEHVRDAIPAAGLEAE